MGTRVRYRSIISDNARWEGFPFRDDDIIISTPPKCGTTWTQTICALLIFQTPAFPSALDLISPWLDQSLRDRDGVFSDLEAQEHRRFIKSHTPFDGLPHDDRVTYVCVARDPRDVAISFANHMDNLDLAEMLRLRDKAVGNDDLEELMPDGPPPPPSTDPVERFWSWVDEDPGASSVSGLAATLHHLETFWQAREEPNVVLLHYGDLKADLEGQMRALAARLGIEVPERLWPELARAATFEEMRRHNTKVAPNATEAIWLDTGSFFNKGTSGQWRDVLDDGGLHRYAARVGELVDDEVSNWVHEGPITGHVP